MLSYQHGYHAGNHADVLKHTVLLAVIRHMQHKAVPISYIDTHAGAGMYNLHHSQANKTQEWMTGIGKLWLLSNTADVKSALNLKDSKIPINNTHNLSNTIHQINTVNTTNQPIFPELINDYLHAIAQFNPIGQCGYYPGSPLLILAKLRTMQSIPDTLRVFERHPAERLLLESFLIKHTPTAFTSVNRQKVSRVRPVLIQGEDGFMGLSALLPPLHRRALVLIDPSYELKTDYRNVLHTLRQAMSKFPSATYIIWYPMLKRIEAQQLIPRLKTLSVHYTSSNVSYLNIGLAVKAACPDGFGGLWGSGLFVINPPWTLEADLKTVMPVLKTVLAQDNKAYWTLESN